MFIHPSIQLEISRQRQQALLAESERHRIAKAAVAAGRPLNESPSLHEPSPTTTVRCPQGASA
jgi:hypothetical protein